MQDRLLLVQAMVETANLPELLAPTEGEPALLCPNSYLLTRNARTRARLALAYYITDRGTLGTLISDRISNAYKIF